VQELHFDRTHLGVLPSAWYSASAIHALLDAIVAGFSPEERTTFARKGAEAVLRVTLRGIYKMLFAMLVSLD
jgi:hypothetical protein